MTANRLEEIAAEMFPCTCRIDYGAYGRYCMSNNRPRAIRAMQIAQAEERERCAGVIENAPITAALCGGEPTQDDLKFAIETLRKLAAKAIRSQETS